MKSKKYGEQIKHLFNWNKFMIQQNIKYFTCDKIVLCLFKQHIYSDFKNKMFEHLIHKN